jgi:RNA polymerase sigma-70 factor (sigma-E family)
MMGSMGDAEVGADIAAPTSARRQVLQTSPVESASPPTASETPTDGFDELYRREYEPMVRLAFLLTGSNELAEDAAHDAFAKVYERWSRLDRPGAYLRTCVVNRCRDLLRRRRVERERSPQPVANAHLQANEVVDALAKLPVRQRAALVLRYYEDLSEADIAEALGVRRGTVKSLVSRGLDQLREVIER